MAVTKRGLLVVGKKKGQYRYGSQTARWAGIWKLSIKKRSNDSGTWFVPSVEFAGYVQDKSLFEELTKTYESVSGNKIQ